MHWLCTCIIVLITVSLHGQFRSGVKKSIDHLALSPCEQVDWLRSDATDVACKYLAVLNHHRLYAKPKNTWLNFWSCHEVLWGLIGFHGKRDWYARSSAQAVVSMAVLSVSSRKSKCFPRMQFYVVEIYFTHLEMVFIWLDHIHVMFLFIIMMEWVVIVYLCDQSNGDQKALYF